MDNMGCVQVRPAAPRKEKKKQPKDELDRNKQAEKKRRRLEKALATSAAIISELEKKKQKKKEELQRLDEEGAAIAEAVALQVLCDDQGDSCQIVLKKSDMFELDPWNHAGNIGVLMGGLRAGTTYQSFAKHPVERVGWVSDAYGPECKWNGCEFGWSFTTGNEILRRDAVAPHFVERGQGAELSAGLMAAQAVSALKIADVHEDAFAGERRATIVINGMMESGDLDLWALPMVQARFPMDRGRFRACLRGTFMWKRCGNFDCFFAAEFGPVQLVEEEKVYSISFLWMYTNIPLLICLWMLIISKSFGVPSTVTRLLQEPGWW